MINFNDIVKENIKEHNPKWPQFPDHPYRILIIEGFESGKTNLLFNLINHQSVIDKIYLHAEDPYKAKYQFLIKNVKMLEQSILMIQKLLLNIQTIWLIFLKNIEDYNRNKKRKILIVFDGVIADMLSNKKLNPIVT